VQVRTDYGRSGDKRYTYIAPPTITKITPTRGPAAGGTTVTISGTNLVPGTAVTFGGARSGQVTANGSTLTAVTPKHAPGTVDVVVTTPGGAAKSRYTYS